MKVALVTPYHPDAVLGGQERMIKELCAGFLKHKGAEAKIISLGKEGSRRFSKFGHIPVSLILSSNLDSLDSFDIIHAQGWASEAVLAKKQKKPVLVTLYGTIAQYMENVALSPFKKAYLSHTQLAYERNACKKARWLASLCKKQKQEMQMHYGCAPDAIRAIDCGIDTNLFVQKKKEEARARMGLENYEKVVLACGRMSIAHKGFDILLQIAGKLPEGDVLVVNGQVPENLRSMMPKNMVAMKTEWRSMPYLYSAADLFVHPSRYEGFGLATCEAMACGTPAVAFDTGAAAELIGQNRGGALIKDVKDEQGFVSSALSLLEDDALLRKAGKAASASARRFSKEKMVTGYISYYRDILSEA